jgi:K+-transporting ATPase ATPase C chain
MKNWIISARALLFFTVLLGGIYPLAVTSVAKLIAPSKAAGGIIRKAERVVGARLIAQEFKRREYFWPRPSAIAYNPVPSGGSNLGPTSKALRDRLVQDRARGVEGELLYASASGLDPEISPEGALAQVARVAKARNLPPARVAALVHKATEGPQLGFLGEARVNVLELNLELDHE